MREQNTYRGTGKGKLLLFGEHAAVYGFAALGVPLPAECRFAWDPDDTGTESRQPDTGHGFGNGETLWTPNRQLFRGIPELSAGSPPAGDPAVRKSQSGGFRLRIDGQDCAPGSPEWETVSDLSRALRAVLPGYPGLSGSVRIDSDVPRAGGFGASAALCTAFAGAVQAFLAGNAERIRIEACAPANSPYGTEPADAHGLWQLANHLEKQFHSTPSGIDTGLSLAAGPVFFAPRGRGWTKPQPLRPWYGALPDARTVGDPHVPIVYGALPRNGTAKRWIEAIRTGMVGEDPRVCGPIQLLGSLASEAGECFETQSVWEDWPGSQKKRFIRLVEEAHRHLAFLGLSTPELERVLELGKECGFPAGKLSGAGGGGAFYFVSENRAVLAETASALGERLRSEGIELTVGLTILS